MEGVLNMSEQNLKQVLAKKQSILQGDAERIAKQRAAGKLTARERVAKLLDAGSFVETDALVSRNGDYAGVVTGSGTVQDRPVYVFAQDFTVHGGAMGQMQAQKIVKVLDLAQKTGAPVIALCDSAGVRIDEGVAAMNAYASVFTRLAKLSGVVPVIALVLGPVVGGAAMIAQLADITIEAENVGQLMVYGPQVMSAISGKTVDAKAVGGAKAMAAQGGEGRGRSHLSGGAGAGLSARLQRGGCRDCGHRRHEPHSARVGRGGRGKPAGCHGGRRGVCGAFQGLR